MKVEELTKKIRQERTLLLQAKRFGNDRVVSECLLNLTVLNSRIADLVMDALERDRYRRANNTVSPTVKTNVNVSDDSSLNLGSPDRNGLE